MRQYLDSLKVRGHKILSDDTMNYLTAPGSQCAAYEFKQLTVCRLWVQAGGWEWPRIPATLLDLAPRISPDWRPHGILFADGDASGRAPDRWGVWILRAQCRRVFRQQPRVVLRNKPPYALPPPHHTHHKSAQGIQTTNQERTAGSVSSPQSYNNHQSQE